MNCVSIEMSNTQQYKQQEKKKYSINYFGNKPMNHCDSSLIIFIFLKKKMKYYRKCSKHSFQFVNIYNKHESYKL